jgi:hypothetical protein
VTCNTPPDKLPLPFLQIGIYINTHKLYIMTEETFNMGNTTDNYHKYHSRVEEQYRLMYGTETKTLQVKVPVYLYHQMVELKGRLMARDWCDFMARIIWLSKCSFNPDMAAFSAEYAYRNSDTKEPEGDFDGQRDSINNR